MTRALTRAVLVCDQSPFEFQNGAATYNRRVLNLFKKADIHVDIIVTGDRFSFLKKSNEKVLHVQAREIRRFRIPITLRSIARLFRADRIIKIFKAMSGDRENVAYIGSFLNDSLVTSVKKIAAEKTYDIVLIDTIFRSAALRAFPESICKILICHDVFSARSASFKDNGFRPSPDVSEDTERSLVGAFDVALSISHEEKEKLIGLGLLSQIEVISPHEFSAAVFSDEIRNRLKIFYLGSSAYHNVEGLDWFIRDIWPLVLQEVPQARLEVIGSIGDVFKTPVDNVTFYGSLEDCLPIARECNFAINPVRMGSGVKIKMVDYMKLNLPSITTTNGASGLQTDIPAPLEIVDGPESFSASVINWLKDSSTVEANRRKIPPYLGQFSDSSLVGMINTSILRLKR